MRTELSSLVRRFSVALLVSAAVLFSQIGMIAAEEKAKPDLASLLPRSTILHLEVADYSALFEKAKATSLHTILADPGVRKLLGAVAGYKDMHELAKLRLAALGQVLPALRDSYGKAFAGRLSLSLVPASEGRTEFVVAIELAPDGDSAAWAFARSILKTLGGPVPETSSVPPIIMSESSIGGYRFLSVATAKDRGLVGLSFCVNKRWLLFGESRATLEAINMAIVEPLEAPLSADETFAQARKDASEADLMWFLNYNYLELYGLKGLAGGQVNVDVGPLAALNPFSSLSRYVAGIYGGVSVKGQDIIERTQVRFMTDITKLMPFTFMGTKTVDFSLFRFFPPSVSTALAVDIDFATLAADPMFPLMITAGEEIPFPVEEIQRLVNTFGTRVASYMSIKGFAPDDVTVVELAKPEETLAILREWVQAEILPVKVQEREVDGRHFFIYQSPSMPLGVQAICIADGLLFNGTTSSISQCFARGEKNLSNAKDILVLSERLEAQKGTAFVYLNARQLGSFVLASLIPVMTGLTGMMGEPIQAPVFTTIKNLNPIGASASFDKESVFVETSGIIGFIGVIAFSAACLDRLPRILEIPQGQEVGNTGSQRPTVEGGVCECCRMCRNGTVQFRASSGPRVALRPEMTLLRDLHGQARLFRGLWPSTASLDGFGQQFACEKAFSE